MAKTTRPKRKGRMAILVGGGPAPGINGVISGAALEALDRGHEVVGLYAGFESLCHDRPIDLSDGAGPARLLDYADLTHIHWKGGSVLNTSRRRPDDEELSQVVSHLDSLGVESFLTIGGDDTLGSSRRVEKEAGGRIRVAHIPKTIDNDLPLPGDTPTFGFETARHRGAEIVQSLLNDAKATRRWYFVVMMGRAAGHLALGAAKSAGATCAIIPEEFKEGVEITLRDVADTVISSMLVRGAVPRPRPDGVVVIAEGVADRMSDRELKKLEKRHLAELGRDDHGNRKLADIQLALALKLEVEERLGKRFCFRSGPKLTNGIVVKDVGYELRSCHPIPFDIEYTRNLGYAGAKFLLSGKSGSLIAFRDGRSQPIKYGKLPVDSEGKIVTREVDIRTHSYEAARRFMLRLEPEDLAGSARSAALREAAGGMSPAAFEKRFARVLDLQAYPPRGKRG